MIKMTWNRYTSTNYGALHTHCEHLNPALSGQILKTPFELCPESVVTSEISILRIYSKLLCTTWTKQKSMHTEENMNLLCLKGANIHLYICYLSDFLLIYSCSCWWKYYCCTLPPNNSEQKIAWFWQSWFMVIHREKTFRC